MKLIDILEEVYTLIDGNEDDTSAKLSSFILASDKNIILMPLNIGENHLVGIAARKYSDKVVLHYMDSELNTAPESLFAELGRELKYHGYFIELRRAKVEKQKYSNCGPEVIENLTAFASGRARTSQEEAIPKHSTLLEKHLLKDFGNGESTSDSAHGSVNKNMLVLSESATISGNVLFYEISRVSDVKKSVAQTFLWTKKQKHSLFTTIRLVNCSLMRAVC